MKKKRTHSGSRTDLRRQTASSLVSTGLGDRLGILGAVSFCFFFSFYSLLIIIIIQQCTSPAYQVLPTTTTKTKRKPTFLVEISCQTLKRPYLPKERSNLENGHRFGFLATSSFKWHQKRANDVYFRWSKAGSKKATGQMESRVFAGKPGFWRETLAHFNQG